MLIQYMNWTENVIIDVIGTGSYNYDFHTGILPQNEKGNCVPTLDGAIYATIDETRIDQWSCFNGYNLMMYNVYFPDLTLKIS